MNAEAMKAIWVKKGAKWWPWSTQVSICYIVSDTAILTIAMAFKLSLHPGQLARLMLDDIILMGFPLRQQWEIDGSEKVSCYIYDAIVFVVHCLKLRRLACWIRGQCLGTMSGCTQGADSAPWCTSRNPYSVWHTWLWSAITALSQVLDQFKNNCRYQAMMMMMLLRHVAAVVVERDSKWKHDLLKLCSLLHWW